MAIPGSAHPCFSLGGLLILGGTAGYFKKGSRASLGAGIVTGGLLIGSGAMICKDSQFEGHSLAAGTSAVLAGGMGHRFLKGGKFMPAGLIAAVGAVSAAFHVKKALEWRS
mmetsp:Transcript_12083/g.15085  ORF Transcript_12083/g.15085 Transcript_12083/m.15085 type:complete len:111 (-) Transcript_12083:280-612(-)|eukprot:CAMPEP_0172494956 /NCGR_PEP_ID=MMETSP1066-20121228/59794_1 /TAXON_ID=671091 /ORGANISM="Coscinodiscus wailesii, Strain CCMP2513" /LENGTH=110 /DNA_ID=CAMNT_0013266313 /DNA_START=243 /DNA_END=575 /DNA_ORIENTATION=-